MNNTDGETFWAVVEHGSMTAAASRLFAECLREEGRFLAMALFANTLYCWAKNTALTMTNASNVSILVSTSPIITALVLSGMVLSEQH